MIYKVTNHTTHGEYNYYSIKPCMINNSGSSLLLMIDAIGLAGNPENVTGLHERRVTLMGNGIVITEEQVPIEYFLKESELSEDEADLVKDLIGNAIEEYARALKSK